jgi:hypothetical protein
VKLAKQAAADGAFNKNKQMPGKNALQEGQARIAPKKMSKGGAMHKMPDGTMMKGASHKMGHGGKVKKMARGGSSASRRADGCAVKGKTKGRVV